ncbi:MAG TPA: DNA mismatch repair endonuclease MutL, partial [Lysinibacillus sp.]|nr:DNA mismatch repair endonuclease MutL [Lysinibacillus sp.]
MGNIQIMDEWLSNKIAAGEVVERPASVVKELVENAIDAGSTSIDVFLLEAGLTSIQVIDNGSGMDEEDAIMSFSRHATSKIHQEHDLFRIRTLGFRGEALASIASVSKMTLITSNGESGTHLELEGGHMLTHKPGPLRKGTDLTVSQLFFNTPARLKYMKTIQTELGHTIDLMNRLALSNPQIAFRLLHNGQILLQTNGRGDVQQVLAAIYGVHNTKKMVFFQGESHDYRISGYVTLPEVTRASKNYMSLFVNGRWVKHYLVQKAIVDAYHTYLPIERFPIVVLYIEGDPFLTDVNVHPAKHQIRLSKEPELLKLIEETIRERIRSVIRVPQMEKKEKIVKPATEQLNIWKPAPKIDVEKMNAIVEKLYDVQTVQENNRETTVEPEPISTIVEDYVQPTPPLKIEEIEEVPVMEQHEELADKTANEPFPELEVVGQIHGTYIVAQMEDGFYLIDQHAAQERIKYEF